MRPELLLYGTTGLAEMLPFTKSGLCSGPEFVVRVFTGVDGIASKAKNAGEFGWFWQVGSQLLNLRENC